MQMTILYSPNSHNAIRSQNLRMALTLQPDLVGTSYVTGYFPFFCQTSCQEVRLVNYKLKLSEIRKLEHFRQKKHSHNA